MAFTAIKNYYAKKKKAKKDGIIVPPKSELVVADPTKLKIFKIYNVDLNLMFRLKTELKLSEQQAVGSIK